MLPHHCPRCGTWCQCARGHRVLGRCAHPQTPACADTQGSCAPGAVLARFCLHPRRLTHTETLNRAGTRRYNVCASCGSVLTEEILCPPR